MSDEDPLALLVEFKVFLVRAVESYLGAELTSAARAQGRRLPVVAKTLLRGGAASAVARLGPGEVAAFAAGPTWEASLRHAVRSGAWERLAAEALRFAFPLGPA